MELKYWMNRPTYWGNSWWLVFQNTNLSTLCIINSFVDTKSKMLNKVFRQHSDSMSVNNTWRLSFTQGRLNEMETLENNKQSSLQSSERHKTLYKQKNANKLTQLFTVESLHFLLSSLIISRASEMSKNVLAVPASK